MISRFNFNHEFVTFQFERKFPFWVFFKLTCFHLTNIFVCLFLKMLLSYYPLFHLM